MGTAECVPFQRGGGIICVFVVLSFEDGDGKGWIEGRGQINKLRGESA